MARMNQQNGQGVHVAIEIADLNLAVSIEAKLGGTSQLLSGSHCSIYKVHEKFRKINKYAYTPEMVAVGPYHHGEGCLLAMEPYKLRYANAFFTRTGKSVQECVQAIRILEKDIRKSYSEPVDLNSDQFVEMMLVDGLFIIELFRKSAEEVEIDKNDPIFSNIWSMSSLIRDMILLENQIPMLVLDKLFEMIPSDTSSTTSFSMLALSFFNPLMPREKAVLEKYSKHHGKHLLDLLGNTFGGDNNKNRTTFGASPQLVTHNKNRTTFRDSPQLVTDNKNRTWTWKFVPCVTELRRAGVKFKKGDSTGSFLDIKFSMDGVLEIPEVIIQDQTDSLLRNLIASEQCCDGCATHMTSYAFFMNSLINSPEDVGFLCHQGIITNYLGHDEDVSNMFNKLCSEVTLVKFYYVDLCKQVNTYYKTRWHRWRATLKRDYFNNPWTTVSFFAAILLLLLTLIQAIFSVLSYTKPK